MTGQKRPQKVESKETVKEQSVALVIGAGVGGMRAALDIAESGRKVYLLDRSPKVGGTASQLDKWFPTDDCSLCKLLPTLYTSGAGEFCLRRTLIHPNIEILTSSELEGVEGKAGDFKVTVLRKPQMVDRAKCVGCNKCVDVCPIEVEDEFNEGLAKRKVIYLSHPNAVPNNYCIDVENCDRCGKCVEVCPTHAIDLDAKEETVTLKVGAIVADPGFVSFRPEELQEFGYGRFPNVVTSTEFERMLSGTGPGRPKKAPKRVAFFQCVGSRDEKRPYCSSACCMYAIKEAKLLKEQYPDSEPSIFYMDMRTFGKGYYKYFQDAVKEGVRFVRSRVPAVKGMSDFNQLIISYEDESGKLNLERFDMVVLSVGQTKPASARELVGKLGIELNRFGFCGGFKYDQLATSRDGVFVCGSFSSPADIPDTVIRASAAASEAVKLVPVSSEPAEISSRTKREPEPSIGVFLCSCGEDIPAVIDLEKIAEGARKLSCVKAVASSSFLCVSEGLTRFAEVIKEKGVNRVVVAACSVHPYTTLFRKAAETAGVDPEMLTVVNIREQLSWVHEKSEAATEKAQALISGAVQNVVSLETYAGSRQEVVKKAVVVGGGMSGLTAAVDLAESGYDVELVEKTTQLGGKLLDKPASYEGESPKSFLEEKISATKSDKKINVRLESQIKSVQGSAGNFAIRVASGDSEEWIKAGAVVIAVGADEHRTDEFGFGQSDRIIALSDFEKELYTADSEVSKAKSYVFIQCVGSRTKERPFCSRTCCSETMLHAARIKEVNPDADVFVLYREIMTYGFNEELYRKARNAGVIFIRYDVEKPPKVETADSKPRIFVRDRLLDENLSLRADYLVLAFGLDSKPAQELSSTLGLAATDEGFFKEVNVKFRPLDLSRDGVYVCGKAHSPMSISESITSGHAAAARAGSVLSRRFLPVRSTIAEVNKRKCAACELCVTTCPFEARYMDYDEMVARVIEHTCQGCGACCVACPNGASRQRGFGRRLELSMVDASVGF